MNAHLAAAHSHARELGAQLRRLDEIDAWTELAPIVTDARRELGRIVLELAELHDDLDHDAEAAGPAFAPVPAVVAPHRPAWVGE